MSDHAPPPYSYPPGPPVQAPRPSRGRGFGIAALVLGVLALLGAWIPVINLGAGVMAIIGVILGGVGLSRVKKGLSDGAAMARVGVSLGAAALVVVVVMNVLFAGQFMRGVRAALEEGSTSTSSAAPAPAPGSDLPQDGTADGPTGEEPTTPVAALALGTPAQVGDYTVTVTGITQDADDAVAAFEASNPPPAGQYVTVDFSVSYDGDAGGEPFFDLTADFLGTDSRNYSDADCSAIIENDGYDVPTLRRGGTADYSICFDVPAGAIAGGDVQVSDAFALDQAVTVWDGP